MQPTQPTVEKTARAFPFRGHDFCSNVVGAPTRLDSWKNRRPKKVLAGVAEMEGGEVVSVSGAGNHANGSLFSPLNCSAGWLAWTTPSPNRPR